jgi:hypothetical protein
MGNDVAGKADARSSENSDSGVCSSLRVQAGKLSRQQAMGFAMNWRQRGLVPRSQAWSTDVELTLSNSASITCSSKPACAPQNSLKSPGQNFPRRH